MGENKSNNWCDKSEYSKQTYIEYPDIDLSKELLTSWYND